MAPKSVELPKFGGLDLSDDPENISLTAAIDTLDIDLSQRGRVRVRDGYTKWTTSAAASRLGRLWAFVGKSGLIRLFAARPAGNEVIAYKYDGTSVASGALVSGIVRSFTLSGATGESVYGSAGTAAGTILKWSESTSSFSSPAVGYHGNFVVKQPLDNRLVLASEINSASVTQSRVRFSAPGAPETFGANDYVDLLPNDGSQITGAAVYGQTPIVFKDDKFFVFYGNSTDGSGNAIFNYRMVDVGIGIPLYFYGACCASPNGIYFLASDGVYLTTGAAPVKVSSSLDRLFGEASALSSYYQDSVIARTTSWGTAQMAWMQGRLFVSVPTGSSTVNNRLLVLDPDVGWMIWSIGAAGLAAWLPSPGTAATFDDLSFRRMFFSYSSGTNDIGILTPGVSTDAGTTITGRYRTGFWDPGQPGTETWIRETLFDGTGTVTVKTAVNDIVTLGTGQAITLGTAPAVANGRDRRSTRGRNVSYEFSGAGPWSLSRVEPIVWAARAPGMKAG